jgi:hypothetical protein
MGEPHSANVIRDPRGRFLLVDWDTTLVAPRERDLRMVLDQNMTGWDEYCSVVGSVRLDERAMRLYHRWWELAEICIFTQRFRRRHGRTDGRHDPLVAGTDRLPANHAPYASRGAADPPDEAPLGIEAHCGDSSLRPGPAVGDRASGSPVLAHVACRS